MGQLHLLFADRFTIMGEKVKEKKINEVMGRGQ